MSGVTYRVVKKHRWIEDGDIMITIPLHIWDVELEFRSFVSSSLWLLRCPLLPHNNRKELTTSSFSIISLQVHLVRFYGLLKNVTSFSGYISWNDD
jgi:hypothetical protein